MALKLVEYSDSEPEDDKNLFVSCHIYLEYMPNKQQRQELLTITTKEGFNNLVYSNTGVPLPLHISISDTLRIHSSDLQRLIRSVHNFALSHSPLIDKVICGLQVMPNPSQTKEFLTLTLFNNDLVVFANEFNNYIESLSLDIPAFNFGTLHMSFGSRLMHPTSVQKRPALGGVQTFSEINLDKLCLKADNNVYCYELGQRNV